MQVVFEDSLVLVLPLAYLFVLSLLIGCSLPPDRDRVAEVTAISFLVLALPFGASVWLQAKGRFDVNPPSGANVITKEALSTAVATGSAILVAFVLLGGAFWLLRARAWVHDTSRIISTWLCAVALTILFGFGRLISLHGTEVDSIWADLALGVIGTWLVAKVIMPWAMAEFELVLVNLDRFKTVSVVSALVLALMMLVAVVHGMGTMSASAPIVPVTDVFSNGLSPWLIPGALAFGSAGFLFVPHLGDLPRAMLALFIVVWMALLSSLMLVAQRDELGVQIFIGWFSITCGVFAAEGYLRNSTTIPTLEPRDHTWVWTAVILLSSGFAANLALTTARLGVLIGFVTCVAFIASQMAISHVVLRLDLSTPSPTFPKRDDRISDTLYRQVATGVRQDSATGGILAVFFGYVPLILFSMAGLSTTFLSFIVFYSGFVAIGMGFVVRADVDWLRRCKTKTYIFEETPPDRRGDSIAALHTHIRFHTWWTLICLFPISLLQWLELPLENILRDGAVSTNIWNTVASLDSDLDDEPADDASTRSRVDPKLDPGIG